MTPTIVLVGRPNVGKSTLFNRLTRSRAAIVADVPGLTRDRHYGKGRLGSKAFLAVDTGGFEPVVKSGLLHQMAKQTLQAVDEGDVVIFVVDARQGLTPHDRLIADQLRKRAHRIWLAVNKAEGMQPGAASVDFHELGIGDPWPISSAHGDGVEDLLEAALEEYTEADDFVASERHPVIAIVGRPNVGKSTLVNALVGEDRVIAFDQPGTTRDSIHVDFERDGHSYTLVDTAGVRRRGKVDDMIEKFSVLKTMQSIEDANVAILVLDATQEITEQDAHIAGFILEAGRAVVVAVNKWDATPTDVRDRVKRDFARKLNFLGFANVHYISAKTGSGLGPVFKSVDAAYSAAMAKLSTPRLTRALHAAVERQTPPRAGIFRPKLRYAHQGGTNPPSIVIHGSGLNHVPDSYRRYLERIFSEQFELRGTPVRVFFKQGKNPYDRRDS
jgi:GTP-binding protein